MDVFHHEILVTIKIIIIIIIVILDVPMDNIVIYIWVFYIIVFWINNSRVATPLSF